MAKNAENVSIWWRHHGTYLFIHLSPTAAVTYNGMSHGGGARQKGYTKYQPKYLGTRLYINLDRQVQGFPYKDKSSSYTGKTVF